MAAFLILLVAFVGLFFTFFAIIYMKQDILAQQQALIEEAFAVIKNGDPYIAAAMLVRKRDEIRGDTTVTVQTHRIYRGPDGEYVLFICTAGEVGFATRLTRDRAADALRSSPQIFQQEFPDEV